MKSTKLKLLVLSIICGTLMISCQVTEFDSINDSFPVSEPLWLSENLSVESTGTVYLNVMKLIKKDFMPPGVRITYSGLVIYIDPLEIIRQEKADYIFITHNHADHFSIVDIEKLTGDGTVIIAPGNVRKKLEGYTHRETKLGEIVKLEDLTYEVVPSYNVKRGFFHMPLHKRSDDFAGYILSFDSIRVYHAGDTDLIPEMGDFDELTLVLVPIGEGKTAMTPRKAAEAVNLMQPDVAIPIHYELGQGHESEFTELVNKSVRVELFHQIQEAR